MPSVSAPSTVCLPPPFLMMGFNDAGCLGEGWHDLERDGRTGVAYRAARQRATLRLGVALSARGVGVLLSASPSLLGKPMTGAIEWAWDLSPVASSPLDSSSVMPVSSSPPSPPEKEGDDWRPLDRMDLCLGKDIWVVRLLPLPPSSPASSLPASNVLCLRIRTDELAVPDRVLRNGDARALGFFVSAVWGR